MKSCTKSKKNKLNVGDKVFLKQEMIDWYCSHIVETWSAYKQDTREINIKDVPDILFWSLAKVSKIKLKGTVTHYGSDDWDLKKNKPNGRNCVHIKIQMPKRVNDLVKKTLTYSGYFSESHLEKVK